MAADQWNSDGSLYGGKAEILTDGENRGYLQVTKMIPGDSVKVTVDVTNSSNVPVKFKIAMEGEDVLIDALAVSATITVDGVLHTLSGDSETDWLSVGVNADGTGKEIGNVEITVTFPHADDNNDYQNKDATIKLMLIAVQGNGDAIYDAEHTTCYNVEDGVCITSDEGVILKNNGVTLKSYGMTFAGVRVLLDGLLCCFRIRIIVIHMYVPPYKKLDTLLESCYF
jgi:hypothetical protein